MSKKRQMILIASLVMSMTAGSAAAATLAACKPSPQVTIDNVSGVYYGESGGKSCEVDLDENGNSKSFVLVCSDKSGKGSYTFDGTRITLTFDTTEVITGTMSKSSDGAYKLTLTINGTTYELSVTAKYEVKFKDGNTVIDTVSVVSGKKISAPTAPEKGGYVFIGWYADSNFSTSFDFGNTAITAATDVYARYVQVNSAKNVYTVKFDAGEGVTNPADVQTINGVVYNLPTVTKSGATFAGWWVSDWNDGAKLTYKYEGQELKENTTMFAVWDTGAPLVSVTSTGVKWTANGVNNSYTVSITAPDGNVSTETVGNTTKQYNFTQSGEYVISVTLNGKTATVYHNHNGLARVSLFTVDGNFLKWNAVENATQYLISVDCGDKEHNHTDLSVGASTQYNFSACEMQADGIKFTVKAVADGYVTSTSEQFVLVRTLSVLSGLNINTDTGVVSWNSVEGAERYKVVILNGSQVLYDGYAQSGELSLSYYPSGNYTIEVTPVAHGYNSPASTSVTYTKSGVSTPANLKIDGYVVKWDAVEGATGYTVKINDKTYETQNTYYDFRSVVAGSESVTISVKANGEVDSLYSDAIVVETAVHSVAYKSGKVSWNAVLGAEKYGIQINSAAEIFVEDGSLSTAVRFTQSGVTSITVFAYDADGNKIGDGKEITVTLYMVSFDTNGGDFLSAVYLATGDDLVLPEATYSGYEFLGWYDRAYGSDTVGKRVESGTFTGTADVTYYAYWSGEEFTVTFDIDDDATIDSASATVQFGKHYTLPTATRNDSRYVFGGWYTEPNGAGQRYTDENGVSIEAWNRTYGMTLYPKWIQAFSFVLLNDGTYAVRQSSQTAQGEITELTIPATYNGVSVSTIAGGAFQSWTGLKIINIPNTIVLVQTGAAGGNAAGSAFQNCTKLEAVNVYPVDGYRGEIFYESYDGALICHREASGETELAYYPYAKQGEYVIPDIVTTIPINVFRNCSLTKITIPASVTYIGDTAFYYNNSLTEVVFLSPEDGKETPELVLGERVFSYCYNLQKVTLPSHLAKLSHVVDKETIEDDFYDMFLSCSALANIYVDGVGKYYSSDSSGVLVGEREINGETLSTLVYCPRGKTGAYQIPSSVNAIGSRAFYYCTKLTSVTVSAQVVEIGTYAFYYCTGLIKVDFLGDYRDDPLAIRDYAFYRCTNTGFKSVTLPENLAVIGNYAFGYCTNLATVSVNCVYGLEEMNYSSNAFNRTATDGGDGSVKTVNLGKGVHAFDVKGVFGGAGSVLTTVTVDSANTNFSAEAGILFNADKTELIFYPSTKANSTYNIPASVKRIGKGAFGDVPALTSINIGTNIEEISDEAFYNCPNLAQITFASGRTKNLVIGNTAFGLCTSLTTVTLPETLISVGDSAFIGCSGLKVLNLPKTLAKLGTNVFTDCPNFETIVVAEGNSNYASVDGVLLGVQDEKPVSVVYSPTGNKGDEYNRITLPSTVKTVGASAFAGNPYIKEIIFEADSAAKVEKVEIGEMAFYKCTALEKVVLPTGLEEITSRMLYECTSLKEVNIPYTVAKINKAAFARCFVLDTVKFDATPDGVKAVNLTIESGSTNSTSSTSTPTAANEVNQGVFAACMALGSLTLPERLTTIGNYMFRYSGLEKIYLPSTLTSVGDYAFQYCASLTDAIFAESTESGSACSIGAYAFSSSGLVTVVLPTKIQSLGGWAFGYCADLKNINLDRTELVTIGTYTFNGCTSLESVTLPDTVTTLGAASVTGSSYVFQNCTSLQYVKLSAGLTAIPSTTFNGCSALTQLIIPEGITDLGALTGCTALEEITLPSTIKTIVASALSGCINLKTVNFAVDEEGYTNLESIGASAFRGTALESFTFPARKEGFFNLGASLFIGCTNLTSVHLSKSVNSIGAIFNGCSTVTEISIASDNANLKIGDKAMEGDLIFNVDTSGENAEIVIKKAIGAVSTDGGSYTIPEGITGIDSYAFQAQNNIVNLVLPSTLTYIGDNAFQNCRMLQSVTFKKGGAGSSHSGSASITSIGAYAFNNCVSLNKFTLDGETINTLPGTVSTIGDFAFSKTGFSEFTIPATLTTIGTNAFEQCTSLQTVYHLTKAFNDNLYYYSVNLKTIYFNSTLENFNVNGGNTVASGIFQYCNSLVTIGTYNTVNGITNVVEGSVSFPEKLTAIPANFFQYSGIKRVIIPVTIKDIGANALSNCYELEEVVFDENASEVALGNYAFAYDAKLTKFTNEQVISAIGQYTFMGVEGLTDLSFPNCTSIGQYAFSGCVNLERISIPKVTSIGDYAFGRYYVNNILSGSFDYPACYNLREVVLGSDSTMDIAIGVSAFGYTVNQTTAKGGPITNEDERRLWTLSSLEKINLERVVSLGNFAFAYANFEEVNLPLCTSLGQYVFYECQNLTKVHLNEYQDVTIGIYAFGAADMDHSCAKLKEINLEKVTSVGNYAFQYCTALQGSPVNGGYALDLSGCTSIGISAFGYCSGLVNVTFNQDVVFADSAFVDCVGLTTVNGALKSVGANAFVNCTSLANIDLSSATEIGDYAFENCLALVNIDLSSVMIIGEGAFILCENLTNVTLGAALYDVGSYAFAQCYSLLSADVSSAGSVGEYAFYNCASLEEVKLGPTLGEIAAYTFYGCESLTSIDIPKSVSLVGNSAFFGTSLSGELELTDVVEIRADAFGATNIEKIVLSENVAYIGNAAFGQNAMLTQFVVDAENPYFTVNSEGALYEKNSEDGMQTLICYPAGKTGEVVIDENTIIAPYAFAGCYGVTSIIIPADSTKISEYAFWHFRGDIVFAIPETVTEIEEGAFQGTAMTQFNLPDGLKKIGASAFRDNVDLVEFTIPDGVESIGDYAFAGCTNLVEITIPASVTSLGAHAFDGCKGLKVIYLNEGLETIGERAFMNCTSLENITIPDNVQTVGECAFENCTALLSATFGENVGSLGNYAFYGCSELTTVTFGDNLGVIGSGAFSKQYIKRKPDLTIIGGPSWEIVVQDNAELTCGKLKNVIFKGTVQEIGVCAFRHTAVTEFTLPEGVSVLGDYAFADCLSLTSVTVGYQPDTFGEGMFAGCKSLAKADVKEGVTNLGAYVFSESGVEDFDVSLPETLTAIPSYAFYKSAMTNVELPSSITSIGGYAFAQSGITKIDIPAVTSVGDKAFYYCLNLSEVTLAEGLEQIGYRMFEGCAKITSVVIPSTVIKWVTPQLMMVGDGNMAFAETGLENLELSDGLTTIGTHAFKNTKIKKVNLPATLTNMGDFAFNGCMYLEEATLSDGLKSIGVSLFNGCSNLKNIVLGEGLESISSSAFAGCTSIKELVIPLSVKSIAYMTFSGWTAEQTIIIEVAEGVETDLVEDSSGWTTTWLNNCGAKIEVRKV